MNLESDHQSYPALQTLLCTCTGLDSIELGFASLARINLDLLAQAIQSTHLDLKRLKLKFIDSQWHDSDYGFLLRSLCTNNSLEQFELNWVTHDQVFGPRDQIPLDLCDMLIAHNVPTTLRLSGVPAAAIPLVIHRLVAYLMVNLTLREVTSTPVSSPRFWVQMMELLGHNTVIRKIGAYATKARDRPAAAAAARASVSLQAKSHGRRPWRLGGNIPAGCWPAILAHIAASHNAKAVLYHFLRAKFELIHTRDDSSCASATATTTSTDARVSDAPFQDSGYHHEVEWPVKRFRWCNRQASRGSGFAGVPFPTKTSMWELVE